MYLQLHELGYWTFFFFVFACIIWFSYAMCEKATTNEFNQRMRMFPD
jgi:hypothetical protein